MDQEISAHKYAEDDHEQIGETHDHSIVQKLKSILNMGHSHDHDHVLDLNRLENTEEGIKAVKISFLGLMITAVFQVLIVFITGSVALFADTLHNFSDAFTAVPLYLAFRLSKREQAKKYPYGYGKAEDLAGLFIVGMIGASALLVFYESINRIINPVEIRNLGSLAGAGIIGFIGNEVVAQYRIRKGEQIGSEALVADGLHSRTDGLTSLSILFSVGGIYIGYPIIDPLIGIVIGILILFIMKDAASKIFLRLMDAVEPELLDEIEELACTVDGVQSVHDIKARWSGRWLFIDLHIDVDESITVKENHRIVDEVCKIFEDNLPNVEEINIHSDPVSIN